MLSGAIVLLSLAFLMPAFYYIPKASLAAVIICAVAPMVDYRIVTKMWRISSGCLLCCFFMFYLCTFCVSLSFAYLQSNAHVFHRVGSLSFYCDVSDELLGGAVRHHRGCSCIWSLAAVQYSQTPDKGNIILCAGLCVSEYMTI